MSYDLSDYVDVAERIREFKERFPDGSLQSDLQFIEGGWLCSARAYRTPDDERPGMGHAFEAVPGKTPSSAGSYQLGSQPCAASCSPRCLPLRSLRVSCCPR